jgi:hypothetical protein
MNLRTKTGCLTCKYISDTRACYGPCLTQILGRSRKKKCDEKTPVCGLCSLSKRECQWPTSADLVDRRYASHHQSRHSARSQSPASPSITTKNEVTRVSWPDTVTLRISLPSESVAQLNLSRDLELVISRHFIERYYSLLLLPNCHPDFYDGWITEIQHLMVQHKSLHYSVLANGASHLHLLDENNNMQELALNYYSHAIKDLSKLLTQERRLENHNGLLMSVMLLYLHGCMGRGTYTDIPQHVSAATRILTLRLFSSQPNITSPFDRLAVESVLYQIFLVTTGLWSEDITLDYDFDTRFWVQAETLLDQSLMFPDGSKILNSPVLGVPVSLFRLALSLKQQRHTINRDMVVLEALKSEVEEWEALVLCDREIDRSSPGESANRSRTFYKDASYLYILCISLILEQILSSTTATTGPPAMASSSSWQITKAIDIVRSHENDDEWAMCFIGTWPLYTLGFFMATEEHVQIVRHEVNERWRLTRFSQVVRFGRDLEIAWRIRGLSKTSQMFLL